MSGVVWLGVLANLLVVYTAPSTHSAWRRGRPVVVLRGFALLFLGNMAVPGPS